MPPLWNITQGADGRGHIREPSPDGFPGEVFASFASVDLARWAADFAEIKADEQLAKAFGRAATTMKEE